MLVGIVGAGIAGLGLAVSLRSRGHDSVIMEKSARLRGGGYMIDFFGPGYDAAERMGLLADLGAIHRQIDRLAFLDGGGRERYSLHYADLRRNLFHDRHFNFLRGDLEHLLHSRIEGSVPIRFGASVTGFRDDGDRVHLSLSDGEDLSVDVLVGADGIHSQVRELAFGPEDRFVRPLGYRAAAYIIGHRVPGLRDDTFSTLTEPGRQVAVYPIRDDTTATLFLHRVPGKEHPARTPVAELREDYGGMGWVVPTLLDEAPDRPALYFDEVSQVELPTWGHGRVTLLGDACCAVSLLAGQGASLALASAWILAQELDANRDVSAAVMAYERRVRPTVSKRQAAGRNVARWFVPEDRLHLVVRDAAMRMSAWPIASTWLRHSLLGDADSIG
jgi:2-polyprenyl-6-methoxyphenol hydroxylase-like FAD-dependent oxidoreductase